jgi:phosphopantetheinyl transferase (holo-ACP synthase)
VERAESGAPSLVMTGRAKSLADEAGIGAWHLSHTHSASTAGAYVLATS